MLVYYLAIDGKKSESLTQVQVRDMIRREEVNESTLCWSQGMKEWLPLKEISEFSGDFKTGSEEKDSGEESEDSGNDNEKVGRRTGPWLRLGARGIDIVLFFTIINQILLLALPDSGASPINATSLTLQQQLGILLGINLTFCLYEAILLSTTGTTLGKFLFGITVRDQEGKKLSFKLALQRSLLVSVKGMALLIPHFAPITMMIAHARLAVYGTTSWDRDLRIGISHKKPQSAPLSIALIVYILFIVHTCQQISLELDRQKEAKEEKQEKEKNEGKNTPPEGNDPTEPEGNGEGTRTTPAPESDDEDGPPDPENQNGEGENDSNSPDPKPDPSSIVFSFRN